MPHQPQRKTVTGTSLTLAAIASAEKVETERKETYDKAKAAGDAAFERGEFEQAATCHKLALKYGEQLADARETLTTLRLDLENPADREDARARWIPVIPTEHRGVGEGDAGLPSQDAKCRGCGHIFEIEINGGVCPVCYGSGDMIPAMPAVGCTGAGRRYLIDHAARRAAEAARTASREPREGI